MTKSILSHHGIPTPAYRVAAPGVDVPSVSGLRFPVIVKPLQEDASLGSATMLWCRILSRCFNRSEKFTASTARPP